MGLSQEPYAGMWDYAGKCAPGVGLPTNYRSFSLGCFQWEPKTGRGLKRGKVQKRFSGLIEEADQVEARAREWCEARNQEGGHG